ncbi:MAG: hypothetical protein JWM91_1181 [Rhodospirillales bacterium]|nr:hypothetical protein [Rhodospirillales bacterium]
MTQPKARKLKVYQAPFGFHESIVAAPNQAAALRAWGSHQNLFAEGFAKVATDGAAIEAALAHPETPLRRAIGSSDPFELGAKGLPKVPRAEKPPAEKRQRKAEIPAPPPPDRTALDQAEQALSALEERRRREEEEFSRRWDALQREQESARRTYSDAKKAADAAFKSARRTYRNAGGRA